MPSAGAFIWTGMAPVVKIMIIIILGFTITKKGLFPPAASKGFSQVVMNLCLPSLIFSSIVPSFNHDNISNMGPLIMTAVLYEFLGLLMALVVREIFWVPKNFQWGILILGALSNFGNLPTSLVQSVAESAPFNPTVDSPLGIGYVSIYILVYNLTFFTGLYRVCAWDFIDETPEGPPETLGRKWRRRINWLRWRLGRGPLEQDLVMDERSVKKIDLEGQDLERDKEDSKDLATPTLLGMPLSSVSQPKPRHGSFSSEAQQVKLAAMELRLTRQTSAATVDSILADPSLDLAPALRGVGGGEGSRRAVAKLPPVLASHPATPVGSRPPSPSALHPTVASSPTPIPPHPHPVSPPASLSHSPSTILKTVLAVASTLVTPITSSLIIALIIALISPLKALFVSGVEGWSGSRIPFAPDGKPPLKFIQDTAVLVGNMTVPGALILLGASFARLKIPKPWSKLPIPAIISITVTKMVILPVIGIFFVTSLTNHTSLYPREQKMLSFVSMLLSCSPSAVNQLVVTQLVAPEGKADVLAAFLLCQYAFLFVSTTAVTALSLKIVSGYS